MTTLTVNIQNEKDLPVLQEILDRFGLPYAVDTETEYAFSETEIEGFMKTRQDYLDGKTTTRSWADVKKDLDSAFD
ncbi:MAG: hypothetical protein V4577_29350 [Bacteroidota bacterium]